MHTLLLHTSEEPTISRFFLVWVCQSAYSQTLFSTGTKHVENGSNSCDDNEDFVLKYVEK